MLATAVDALDNLEGLLGPLKALGARHKIYGVSANDYDKVADAFLWTMNQGLGDAFTDDVKDAWVAVYSAVARVMIQGAEYDS